MVRGRLGLTHFLLAGSTLALYGITRLVYNVAGLRFFGVELVGHANVALSLAVLVSLLATTALGPALLRFLPNEELRRGLSPRDLLREVLSASVPTLVLPMVLLLAAGSIHPGWTVSSGRTTALWTTWAVLYSWYTLGKSFLLALNRSVTAVVLELAGFGCFGLALALCSHQPYLYWLPITLYFLPMAVAAPCLAGTGIRFRLHLPPGYVQFGLLAFLGSVSSMGTLYASTLVAAAAIDIKAAGAWSVLLSAISPVLLFPRTLNTVLLPKLSILSLGEPALFRGLSTFHQRLSSLGGATVGTLALVFGTPFLDTLLPYSADGSWPKVWLFAVISLFCTVRTEPLVSALASLGFQRRSTAASFSAGALCALLWMVLVRPLGLRGLAIGYAVFSASLLVMLAVVTWASRRDNTRLVLKFFPSDAVFCGVALALLAGVPMPPAVVLALALALLVTVIFMGSTLLSELRSHEGLFRTSHPW